MHRPAHVRFGAVAGDDAIERVVRTSEAASAHWIPAPSTKLRQSPPFSMAACAVGVDDDVPFNARAANGGSGAGQ